MLAFALPLLTTPEAMASGSADLAVANAVSNPTPNVGDTVTFTVTVTNGGPDAATNVSVFDLLPSGLRFVSANPSQGSYISTSGAWTVGTVAASGGQTLQLTAQVVSASAQTDTARATADQSDPNPNNNSASATETPQRADLALTQSVDNPTPLAGQSVTITVTLTDKGPNQATNVTVKDLLPSPGLVFVSATPSQGSYTASGVWTVGTVTPATPQTLALNAMYSGPGRVVNTASVSHSDQFDPDLANNSSSLTVPRTPTQTVVASSANPSLSGHQLDFTAKVSPVPDGGSVTFTVDGTPVASVPVDKTTGTATSPAISSLAVGSHQVVAAYTGDANYLSSSSTQLTQVVNPAPPGPTGPATVAISGLSISPVVFAAASKAGARVKYTLNEAASVQFTVAQLLPGRKGARGRCTRPTRRNRKARECRRLVTRGGFTLTGRSGSNSFHFTGRVKGHPLAPGNYELIAGPTAGGHAGKPVETAFRIRARAISRK